MSSLKTSAKGSSGPRPQVYEPALHYSSENPAVASLGLMDSDQFLVTSTRNPHPSPVYPPNSDQSTEAFCKPDMTKAWGDYTEPIAPLPTQIAVFATFDISVDQPPALQGRKAIVLTSLGHDISANTFYGLYNNHNLQVLRLESDVSHSQIGTIDTTKLSAGTSFTYSNNRAPQQYKKRLFGATTLSFQLPAYLGANSNTIVEWKHLRSKRGTRGNQIGNYALVDAAQQQIALCSTGPTGVQPTGQLKITMAGLGAEAVEQIVVACIALKNMLQ